MSARLYYAIETSFRSGIARGALPDTGTETDDTQRDLVLRGRALPGITNSVRIEYEEEESAEVATSAGRGPLQPPTKINARQVGQVSLGLRNLGRLLQSVLWSQPSPASQGLGIPVVDAVIEDDGPFIRNGSHRRSLLLVRQDDDGSHPPANTALQVFKGVVIDDLSFSHTTRLSTVGELGVCTFGFICTDYEAGSGRRYPEDFSSEGLEDDRHFHELSAGAEVVLSNLTNLRVGNYLSGGEDKHVFVDCFFRNSVRPKYGLGSLFPFDIALSQTPFSCGGTLGIVLDQDTQGTIRALLSDFESNESLGGFPLSFNLEQTISPKDGYKFTFPSVSITKARMVEPPGGGSGGSNAPSQLEVEWYSTGTEDGEAILIQRLQQT